MSRKRDNSRHSVTLMRDEKGEPRVFCDVGVADIVQALNNGGVPTVASCSGHGERNGNVALRDGRELIIADDWSDARRIEEAISREKTYYQALRGVQASIVRLSRKRHYKEGECIVIPTKTLKDIFNERLEFEYRGSLKTTKDNPND